jgi:hypothetical protein
MVAGADFTPVQEYKDITEAEIAAKIEAYRRRE